MSVFKNHPVHEKKNTFSVRNEVDSDMIEEGSEPGERQKDN